MAKSVFDDQVIASHASYLMHHKDDLEKLLGALNTKVSALHGEWTGPAAESFQTYYKEWHTASTKVKTALEGMAAAVAQAAKNYGHNEIITGGQFKGK